MEAAMNSAAIRELIEVAQGRRPADVVLRGGKVVNVFSGEVEEVAVAIAGGRVAGLSEDPGRDVGARGGMGLDGRFLAPAFLDAHIYLGGTQLWGGGVGGGARAPGDGGGR